MRATARLLAISLAGIFMASCQGNLKTAAGNVTAAYTLTSVDGDQVPGNALHTPNGRDIERKVRATFSESDSNITIYWEGAGITTGIISGQVFRMDNHSMIF